MKRSKFIAALMLVLACACFVCVPVFAELPWDADYGGGGDTGPGTDTDTVIDGDDQMNGMDNAPGGNDFPFWWFGYSFRSSLPFVIGYAVNTDGHAGDHHATAVKKNSGSTQGSASCPR